MPDPPGPTGPADPGTPPPFPDSLCHRCIHHRTIRGRATTFVMCTALPEKYPRQPVLRCVAFQAGGEPDRDRDRGT